jgi:hypothetical protein
MGDLTPAQLRARDRVESLIGVAAPLLDLVLATGDRMSRIVAPEDHDPYPVRPPAQPALLEPPAGGSGEAAQDGEPE